MVFFLLKRLFILLSDSSVTLILCPAWLVYYVKYFDTSEILGLVFDLTRVPWVIVVH